MKRRTLMAGAVSAAAAAAGIAWSLRRFNQSGTEAHAGLWDMAFDTPAGGVLTLREFHGRPLLLNFWATWCPPCIKEMPMLDAFYREAREAGWQVVGLAVDAPAQVRNYLAKSPVSFPIGIAGMSGTQLSRALGNTKGLLPFTAVFDKRGRTQSRKLGAVEPADLEAWRAAAAKSRRCKNFPLSAGNCPQIA